MCRRASEMALGLIFFSVQRFETCLDLLLIQVQHTFAAQNETPARYLFHYTSGY